MKILGILTAAMGLISGTGQAQTEEPPSSCTPGQGTLPAAFSGWSDTAQLHSATSGTELKDTMLAPGHAATVALHATPDVKYPLQPKKPGGSVSHGGLVGFSVPAAGTYEVGLSTGAWVDVFDGKNLVTSTAHGQGPACTGIRKLVDFPLHAGSYVLQISTNAQPEVKVIIARHP